MKKVLGMLPYLLVCELAFLLLVLSGINTGGLIVLLFIIMPCICLAASIIYGVLNQFHPVQLLYPLLVGALFITTFYIVFKETVWIYNIAFVSASLVGNAIGYLIGKLVKRAKHSIAI